MEKMILIVYSAAIESKVMEVLSNQGVKTWTRINRIQGTGTHSAPHLDTHVWPGTNNAVFTAVKDEIRDAVLQGLKELKSHYTKEGLKVFVMPLEEVI